MKLSQPKSGRVVPHAFEQLAACRSMPYQFPLRLILSSPCNGCCSIPLPFLCLPKVFVRRLKSNPLQLLALADSLSAATHRHNYGHMPVNPMLQGSGDRQRLGVRCAVPLTCSSADAHGWRMPDCAGGIVFCPLGALILSCVHAWASHIGQSCLNSTGPACCFAPSRTLIHTDHVPLTLHPGSLPTALHDTPGAHSPMQAPLRFPCLCPQLHMRPSDFPCQILDKKTIPYPHGCTTQLPTMATPHPHLGQCPSPLGCATCCPAPLAYFFQ